jgi:hypothetical protein
MRSGASPDRQASAPAKPNNNAVGAAITNSNSTTKNDE